MTVLPSFRFFFFKALCSLENHFMMSAVNKYGLGNLLSNQSKLHTLIETAPFNQAMAFLQDYP